RHRGIRGCIQHGPVPGQPLRLDIKTQVTLDDDEKIDTLIVAVPCKNAKQRASVAQLIELWLKKYDLSAKHRLIVNGTGEYVVHGSIGDCGTTGRKLAVDFYGGNCRIGGGCPWTKDGTKADLALNLFARHIAKANLIHNDKAVQKVEVAVSCCIGRSEVLVNVYLFGFDGSVKKHNIEAVVLPRELSALYGLTQPTFAKLYHTGLFYDKTKAWEQVETLSEKFVKDF
ncbi:MAG: methionine adenosyltransferase domain-containing protein, partial [Alphaproteobacteria bacterium]|nr:methionine adenosyltransferase domain-containing protein [Alphaproteobacteria bacterium]